MTVHINQIRSAWNDWTPSGITNLYLSTLGTEARIHWGEPDNTNNAASGYGFRGIDNTDVEIGATFILGSLRHFNEEIRDGVFLGEVDLKLTVEVADVGEAIFEVRFKHTETSNDTGDPWLDRDFVDFKNSLPQTVSSSGIVLQITGFVDEDGNKVTRFQSPENAINVAFLEGKFVSVEGPTTLDPCAEPFTPVFAPARCSMAPVCPIEDVPIINDCDVPDAPEPLTDCPAIDVPIPAFAAMSGLDGPPGPPGPPGDDGCTPDVTVSSTVVVAYDCTTPTVDVEVVPYGECSVEIVFTFHLCQSYADGECCWFVWCPPGTWMPVAGSDPACVAPGITGDYYGQVEIVCPCPPTTTTPPTSYPPTTYPPTTDAPTTTTTTPAPTSSTLEPTSSPSTSAPTSDGPASTSTEIPPPPP
jgi:hypothetical protein